MAPPRRLRGKGGGGYDDAMKKWLEGKVDQLVTRASKRMAEKAAEKAAQTAVQKVKDTARDALDRAEDVLFGPDESDPRKAVSAADADDAKGAAPERGGTLRRAREDADRRAAERAADEAERARVQRENQKKSAREIDDELAQMKRRLGKK
jgi:hypothetical protein